MHAGSREQQLLSPAGEASWIWMEPADLESHAAEPHGTHTQTHTHTHTQTAQAGNGHIRNKRNTQAPAGAAGLLGVEQWGECWLLAAARWFAAAAVLGAALPGAVLACAMWDPATWQLLPACLPAQQPLCRALLICPGLTSPRCPVCCPSLLPAGSTTAGLQGCACLAAGPAKQPPRHTRSVSGGMCAPRPPRLQPTPPEVL